MDLGKIHEKINDYKKLLDDLRGVEKEIHRLENFKPRSEMVFNLDRREYEESLNAEIQMAYVQNKLKILRKRRNQLISQKNDMTLELEDVYKKLRRQYRKERIGLELLFSKFLKKLKGLKQVWDLLVQEGSKSANTFRCLWSLRSVLGKADDVKTLPPFSRWKTDLNHVFTLLENYLEEIERNANKRS